MRRGLAGGVLALLVLAPIFAGAQAEDPALRAVVEPPAGDLLTTFTFRALGVEPQRGASLLDNAEFNAGLNRWSASTREVGSGAIVTTENEPFPHASIRVENATRAGAVFLSQSVPLSGAPSYAWSFLARGHNVTLVALAQESGYDPARNNATRATFDTTFARPLDASWSTIDLSWSPRYPDSTHVQLFLRVRVEPARFASAGFDAVEFQPTDLASWDLDGDGAEDARGAEVARAFVTPGLRRGTLTHTSLEGRVRAAEFTVDVQNRPPAFSLVDRREALLGEPVLLQLEDLRDPDAAERLVNGDFRQGLSSWSWRVSEVGGDGIAWTTNATPAELRILANATRDGSVFAWQAVPLRTLAPLLLRAEYRDVGAVAHEWLLRERAGSTTRDTPVRLPASAEWRQVAFTWAPQLANATEVSLYLRASVANGTSAELAFREVSLTPATNVTWRWSDGVVSYGPDGSRAFAASGRHEAEVTAADGLGGVTTDRVEVEVRPALGIELDPVQPALAGQTLVTTARAVEEGNDVVPRDLRKWQPSSRETGANATLTVSQEGARALVGLRENPKAGSLHLQATGRIDPGRTYLLEGRASSIGPVNEFAYIIRESGYNATLEGAARETFDTTVRVPAGTAPHDISVLWRPTYDSTHATVYLRALVPSLTDATVEFKDVRFRPLPTPAEAEVSWTGPGCSPCVGASVEWSFPGPGAYDVTATASAPDGRNATRSQTLLVVERLPAAARALDGRILLTWQAPAGVPSAFVLEDDRGRRDTLRVSEARGPQLVTLAARLDPPSRPTNWTVLGDVGGERVPLARFGAALPASAFAHAAVSTAFPRPWAPLTVDVEVSDPEAVEVKVVLRDAEGGVASTAPMSPTPGGGWRAEIPFEWSEMGKRRTVEVVASDARARNETVVLGDVHSTLLVNVDPGRPAVLLLGAIGLVAAATASWRRWGSRS